MTIPDALFLVFCFSVSYAGTLAAQGFHGRYSDIFRVCSDIFRVILTFSGFNPQAKLCSFELFLHSDILTRSGRF